MGLIKQEIKDMWIEALLSGNYKQGKKCLCRSGKEGDEFCCLGVLCDQLDSSKWTGNSGVRYYLFGLSSTAYLLPVDIIYSIKTDGKEFIEIEEALLYLADEMNDKGKSFAEIAEYIQKNL